MLKKKLNFFSKEIFFLREHERKISYTYIGIFLKKISPLGVQK
jgi:hypothetical protein